MRQFISIYSFNPQLLTCWTIRMQSKHNKEVYIHLLHIPVMVPFYITWKGEEKESDNTHTICMQQCVQNCVMVVMATDNPWGGTQLVLLLHHCNGVIIWHSIFCSATLTPIFISKQISLIRWFCCCKVSVLAHIGTSSPYLSVSLWFVHNVLKFK